MAYGKNNKIAWKIFKYPLILHLKGLSKRGDKIIKNNMIDKLLDKHVEQVSKKYISLFF